MKKLFKKYIIYSLLLTFLFLGKVNAVEFKDADIVSGSFIIGSHLFTNTAEYPYTDLYKGNVDTAVVMLGSASFETEDFKNQSKLIIYNKIIDGMWINTLNSDVMMESLNFDILYVNGNCIDPRCNAEARREVTLVYNDGTKYNQATADYKEKIVYGSIFKEPVEPKRLGYDFLCWELDEGDCFDFSTPITEDITLEALWKAREYSVVYHDTINKTQVVKECNFADAVPCGYLDFNNDDFTLPLGYTFVGWSLAETGEKVYFNDDIVEVYGEDTQIDFYSIFSSGTYRVSYSLNGGSLGAAVSPVTEYDPSNLTYTLYEPSKIGYTFNGWTVDESSNGTAKINQNNTFTIETLGNIVLNANWTPNKYNVVYSGINLNDEICVYDQNCSLNLSKIELPAGQVITSITASVGNTEYAIGKVVKNLTTENTNVTVSVTFGEKVFNITYDYDGGVVSTANPSEVKLNEMFTINEPSKKGYTFVKWEDNSAVEISESQAKIVKAQDVTLKAVWVANEYNVYYDQLKLNKEVCIYDTDCELDLSQIKAPAGKEIKEIKALVAGTYYTLGDTVNNLTSESINVNVEVEFGDITYTITYDYDGGVVSAANPGEVKLNEKFTINEPSKKGYSFNSWDHSDAIDIVQNQGEIVKEEDVVLKALWKANEYDVYYNEVKLNDNKCVYDKECTIDLTKITIPKGQEIKSITAFVDGIQLALGEKVKNLTSLDDDVEIDVVFGDITYDINYDYAGGTVQSVNPTEAKLNELFTVNTPSRVGYTFVKWDENSAIVAQEGQFKIVNEENVTFKAIWKANEYNVVYSGINLNDEICVYDKNCTLDLDKIEISEGKEINKIVATDGVNTYAIGNTVKNLTSDNSINVEVEFRDIIYSVDYDYDGGKVNTLNPISTTLNSVFNITEPTKTGYTFAGWEINENVEITGTKVKLIKEKDVVLKAKWSANVYNVHTDNDYSLNNETCVYDSFCDLNFDNIVVPDGKELDHVLATIDGVQTKIGEKVINLTNIDKADIIVTPVFKDIKYQVSYALNMGVLSESNTGSMTLGQTVTLNVPTKVGYNFLGWTVDGEKATIDGNNVTLKVASDVTFTANWEIKKFIVNYNSNNGDYTGDLQTDCTYEECYITDVEPTLDSMIFDGWLYIDVETGSSYIYQAGESIYLDSDSDVTLVAKWVNKDKYSINYKLSGGTFENSPIVSYMEGDQFNLSEPSKTGYTFAGWSTNAGYISDVKDKTGNLDLEATWIANDYYIVLYEDTNGDVELDRISCKYDQVCTLGDNTSNFTDILLGWSLAPNGKLFYGDNLDLINLSSEIDGEFKLYPVLEAKVDDYSIIYYLNGGAFVNPEEVDYSYNKNETLTLPEVTKFGYFVDYWILDNGDVYTNQNNINRDVTLVPIWKEVNEYTLNLTYDYDSNITSVQVNCTFDTPCSLPLNAVDRENYVFENWSLSLGQGAGVAFYDDGEEFDISFDVALSQGTFEFDLVSNWVPVQYSISYVGFDSNDNIEYPTKFTHLDNEIRIPVSVPNNGLGDFVLWTLDGNIVDYCSDDNNYVCISVADNLRDIEITAHYNDEVYSINFVATPPESGSIEHMVDDVVVGTYVSSIIPPLGVVDFEGVTGWFVDDELINLDTYRVLSDITFVGSYE